MDSRIKITVDFETTSELSVSDVGSWRYSIDPTTDVICMAYKVGEGHPRIWVNPKYLLRFMFSGASKAWGGDISFKKKRGKTKKEFVVPDFKYLVLQPSAENPIPVMSRYRPCTQIPAFLKEVQSNPDKYIFEAHNAFFERCVWRHICTERYNWPEFPVEMWECSGAASAFNTLPRSLERACIALDTEHKKNVEGSVAMKQLAHHDSTAHGLWEKYDVLFKYCLDDVRAEDSLSKRLRPLPSFERDVWFLEQEINERGLRLDIEAIKNALFIIKEYTEYLEYNIKSLTDGKLTNIRQRDKLIKWCAEHGVTLENTQAGYLEKILTTKTLPPLVRSVLEIRGKLAKASVSKLEKMLAMADPRDDRARDLLVYHGASTSRFSGRGIQIQNLTRGAGVKVHEYIDLINKRDWSLLEQIDDPLTVISESIRGFIIPSPGKHFFVSDFSNIEGRVIAWLAREEWKLDAFRAFDSVLTDAFGLILLNEDGSPKRKGPDIYLLSYATGFGLPIEKVTKDQRQVGKTMELSLGFGGGIGAFQNMAKNYGVVVSDSEADNLKTIWRNKHPEVVRTWRDTESAALEALYTGRETEVNGLYSFEFDRNRDVLICHLPSGLTLQYNSPRIEEKEMPWVDYTGAKVTRPGITYMVPDSTTGRYVREDTYGGHIFQNCVQKLARDIMCEAMLRIKNFERYDLVGTVHDEVIAEESLDKGSLSEYNSLMLRTPDWCKDLPIAVEGFVDTRYRKD